MQGNQAVRRAVEAVMARGHGGPRMSRWMTQFLLASRFDGGAERKREQKKRAGRRRRRR